MSTYKIYVACLAAYNNGILHGEWIGLDGKSEDDLNKEIEAMLEASPIEDAEEWAVHDYEGLDHRDFGEYPDLGDLVEFIEMLEKHGDAWQAYVDNVGTEYSSEGDFEESYNGAWNSEEDFAIDLLESCYTLDEPLASYFDYDKWTRDLFMCDYTYIDGHVFRAC